MLHNVGPFTGSNGGTGVESACTMPKATAGCSAASELLRLRNQASDIPGVRIR